MGPLFLGVFPDINKAQLADLTGYSKFVPIGLMVGYIFGVFMIPRIISQTSALKIVALLGRGASLALIFLPAILGIYCLALIGFANSLMWPAIWPLAIADLGRFTKTGASMLVTGIVGGAFIPLICIFIHPDFSK